MTFAKIIVIIGIAAWAMHLANSIPIESSDCTCTREYQPICALDGVTYSNKCLFDCEKQRNHNLKENYRGECDNEVTNFPAEDICICPFDLSPICGSDGKTYSNECSMKCEQRKHSDLSLKHAGECGKGIPNANYKVIEMDSVTEQCECPFSYLPVCGSDGRTFSNECEFDCEKEINKNLKISYTGTCKSAPQKSPFPMDVCICNLIYMPVCGTDDSTYSSQCVLSCAKKFNKNLNVKHLGSCN